MGWGTWLHLYANQDKLESHFSSHANSFNICLQVHSMTYSDLQAWMSNWCQAQTRAPGFFLQKYFRASYVWSDRCKVCSRFMTTLQCCNAKSVNREADLQIGPECVYRNTSGKNLSVQAKCGITRIQKCKNTAICVCVCTGRPPTKVCPCAEGGF